MRQHCSLFTKSDTVLQKNAKFGCQIGLDAKFLTYIVEELPEVEGLAALLVQRVKEKECFRAKTSAFLLSNDQGTVDPELEPVVRQKLVSGLHIFRCHEPQVFVDLAVHRLKTFSLDIDSDIVNTHTLS